ncbi:8128_t:CDS:2, partial [Dentiscutata erythropus]
IYTLSLHVALPIWFTRAEKTEAEVIHLDKWGRYYRNLVTVGLLKQKKLWLLACNPAQKRLLSIKLKVGKKLRLFIWISGDIMS